MQQIRYRARRLMSHPSPAALVLIALLTTLGCATLVGTAQAAGPATSVTVALSPSTIVADGTSTTSATATVTDVTNSPVVGDTITFSTSDPGEQVGPVHDNLDGTYTATITSSTTAHAVTITATDNTPPSPPVSGSATLTQTPGPATSVTVALSPSTIVADGTSTTSATATVTDANNNPVAGDAIAFSTSDPGEQVGPVTDNGNGTYTATITSSTTAQPVTITATDNTPPNPTVSGSATLTQTPGPPATLSLQLSPSTIPADEASISTATVWVYDAHGNPVSGQPVSITSSDNRQNVSAVTDMGNGSYTATVSASSRPGTATITASDMSASSLTDHKTLRQIASSTVSLVAAPGAPTTNEPVNLVATVSSSVPSLSPAGTLTFTNAGMPISGCANLPIASNAQTATATCATALVAGTAGLAAVFTSSDPNLAGSTSAPEALSVGPDPTSTSLALSPPSVRTGQSVSYTATVTPQHPGSVRPAGWVQFFDGSQPIAQCPPQSLAASPTSTATCTVLYSAGATHMISARYSGDGNFSSSASATQTLTVQPPSSPVVGGIITATMQWTFYYTAKYTKVLALRVNDAPRGSSVIVICTGKGCPIARRTMAVSANRQCAKANRNGLRHRRTHCGRPTRTVDLAGTFSHRHLAPGARITIEIVRPHWIGKYYRFQIAPRRGPSVRISCLAPGSSRPGVGC